MFHMLAPPQEAILQAALGAVDPARAVIAALRLEGSVLTAPGWTITLDQVRRILVVGAGKAGAPMAQAVEAVLGERISDGCVVVKQGHGAPTSRVRLREAGHPVPTQAGLDAGEEILTLVRSAQAGDLVICLLSGGGSALLEALPPGISLVDLQATTSLLLASGATIHAMNSVRKHLSLVKGGRLAQAVAPAHLLTLVLSDVVGSPLDVIASGPCVADGSTFGDASRVVERYALAGRLPASVSARLRAGVAGDVEETPKAGDPLLARATTVIVGDNAVAAAAAQAEATRQGMNSLILTTFFEGEAQQAALFAVALAREVQAHGRPVAAPACLILGGETTVSLGDNPGRGGRNQEIALAAALALEGIPGVSVVALATDGSDGPTDAAGGVATGDTAATARRLGLDPRAALRAHDAYPLLDAAGALLRTGPTRTNVNDLLFVFVE